MNTLLRHATPGARNRRDGLVAQLLRALCDESEALKRDDPAALAAAAFRKRALLGLLVPRPTDGDDH